MVEPHGSNFRVITTNVLGVRIFRKFTGFCVYGDYQINKEKVSRSKVMSCQLIFFFLLFGFYGPSRFTHFERSQSLDGGKWEIPRKTM